MKRIVFCLSLLSITATIAFSGSCPTVWTGSACALGNKAYPPYYEFCGGRVTGLYFDSLSLTFNPGTSGAISVSSNTCGQDCTTNQNCYQSTITASGIDCNGIRQTISHNDCCEETPD
jgi:hypothetical protein